MLQRSLKISSIRFGAPNLRSIGAYCFLIRKQINIRRRKKDG